jgi:predicted nucleotide-binding protein (sugar kinase/HSP70/actin superfamily)
MKKSIKILSLFLISLIHIKCDEKKNAEEMINSPIFVSMTEKIKNDFAASQKSEIIKKRLVLFDWENKKTKTILIFKEVSTTVTIKQPKTENITGGCLIFSVTNTDATTNIKDKYFHIIAISTSKQKVTANLKLISTETDVENTFTTFELNYKKSDGIEIKEEYNLLPKKK